MSLTLQIITVLLTALSTMATRFLTFIFFKGNKPVPKYILYLGDVLPPAIFGLLVVYCLKDVTLFSGTHGLPELIAITLTVLVHLSKKNTLLSIAVGTIVYMLLVQFVFVV